MNKKICVLSFLFLSFIFTENSNSNNTQEKIILRSDLAIKSISRDLFASARLRPYYTKGKIEGISLSNISQSSLFFKIGLQSGDIIISLNDKPIKSYEDILKIYNILNSGSDLTIKITRRGLEHIEHFIELSAFESDKYIIKKTKRIIKQIDSNYEYVITDREPTKQYVTMDFHDEDIKVFIKFASAFCDKNFAIDPRVKGKITVMTPGKVDSKDVYELFISVLNLNGYTVIDGKGISTIIPVSPKGNKLYYKIAFSICIHALFWLILIYFYPNSSQVQAIFFWNPYVRKIFGLFYIHFALTWIPFLRQILFKPFKESLLADAMLNEFNEEAYFMDCDVRSKQSTLLTPINKAIPQIKGQIILEGESGLGKSMFLRYLVKNSNRVAIFLQAKRCSVGVIEAIQNKLHGVAKDAKFLNSLIYSGALDICIDGLNEVNSDTRAKITQFVELYFKGNILMATQPLEWVPPSTAEVFVLKPLTGDKIMTFLISQYSTITSESSFDEDEFKYTCENYIAKFLTKENTEDANNSIQLILSNPMDLSIIAQMLGNKHEPDLFRLQEQYYKIMKYEYERIYVSRHFPLLKFSEHVYLMKVTDKMEFDDEIFKDELKLMERFKIVLSRQVKEKDGKYKEKWYFRHEKIMDYFIVQVFISEEGLPSKHLNDPRMRGVYFMLATLLPYDAAFSLREMLIQYAADTKDHTVSDTFIKFLRIRNKK